MGEVFAAVFGWQKWYSRRQCAAAYHQRVTGLKMVQRVQWPGEKCGLLGSRDGNSAWQRWGWVCILQGWILTEGLTIQSGGSCINHINVPSVRGCVQCPDNAGRCV